MSGAIPTLVGDDEPWRAAVVRCCAATRHQHRGHIQLCDRGRRAGARTCAQLMLLDIRMPELVALELCASLAERA